MKFSVEKENKEEWNSNFCNTLRGFVYVFLNKLIYVLLGRLIIA